MEDPAACTTVVSSLSRRQLLATGASAVGVAIVPATALGAQSQAAAQTAATPTRASWPYAQSNPIAPADAPSRITVTRKDEPGERLVVTGTVLGPDGKTPVRGASIYVFQVDAAGKYAPGLPTREGEANPRLHGYMRSDARGRYAYTTIRPAPYFDRESAPQHMHYIIVAQGYQVRGAEMYFLDDPNMQQHILSYPKIACHAQYIRSSVEFAGPGRAPKARAARWTSS